MRIKFDKPFDLLLTNGNKAGQLHGEYDVTELHSGWWAVRELDGNGEPTPEVIANIHINGFVAT